MSYDDDDLDYGEEDNTLQESGDWARMRRPSGGKLSASVGARQAMPPPTSWIHRPAGKRTSEGSSGARTSTSSAGSAFSLEVTIPEGGHGEREGSRLSSSSSTSRMARPGGGRSSLGSSTHGAGARDSSGSSTFDQPMGMGSRYRRVTPTKRPSADEMGTPTSTASTLSIPMPGTPRDGDGLSSSTTPVKGLGMGMGTKFNKEKSLPPLPSGGLRRPSSRMNLTSNSNSKSTSSIANTKSTANPTSNAKSTSTSPSNAVRAPSDGSGSKYAFPRARTFSSTSSASGTSHALTSAADGAGSPPRPLQLPRQAVSARPTGDRAAVPVPSIPAALTLSPPSSRGALRTPSLSSARFASAGYSSAPSSPLPPGMNSTPMSETSTGMVRPKPRTGTGMVYRTSTASMGSKMRAPLVLSSVSASGVGGAGVGGGGGGGVPSIGRAAGRPIVL